MTIRVTVWNENVHERQNRQVAAIYPDGIHGAIASALGEDAEIATVCATLDEPEHGLTVERLAATDVLFWWGHRAHGEVDERIVERVCESVWSGMGMVFLHSAHFSRPFKRLMGTPCNLSWREAGERERLWVTSPNHPIAEGIGDFFEIEHEEMYGEPFGVPEPLETVFVSWFQGGEVFRSGLTYKRGAGHIFYFRPGHETYPTYHETMVRQVLRNAARWAFNPARRITDPVSAPNVPVERAPERIEARGIQLHAPGEEGYR